MIEWVLVIIGEILVVIGAICDLLGAIGLLRFPNFYVRLHALTVGTIGGAFVPLIGVALIAIGSEFLGFYRWVIAGTSIVTALLLLFLAPAGSHAIARATHRSQATEVYPKTVDKLEEDRERGELK
ncbi:MAG: monovalent cation/H(+) antiporter subunit G [Ignisphaera sp.]|uniref:Cation:proton antiporter n=1 Tax=Ignisphaera aggregans TaxID=334771 RepID=A0A7J3MZ19_9CREN